MTINKLFGQILGQGAVDVNNNIYETVVIGPQEWFSENLRAKNYSNGEIIPNIIDNATWANVQFGGWSYWGNDSTLQYPQGKLYNWYAVSDVRNICPTGWKAPSFEDWTILFSYYGGTTSAGESLKTTGTLQNQDGLWTSPNIATNSSGFSAIPIGYRDNDGFFGGTYEDGWWWTKSASSNQANSATYINLAAWSPGVGFSDTDVKNGFSVRCIKSNSVNIEEIELTSKKIVKKFNLLGQELDNYPSNSILFILFSDGSVVKTLVP